MEPTDVTSWKQVLLMVWTAVNSPAGIAFIASALIYGLNKLYAKKPAWKAYEGTIIAAIKTAEKAIPDGTPNKSLSRLDTALKLVLAVFEQREGRSPSQPELAELTEGVQITHSALEDRNLL